MKLRSPVSRIVGLVIACALLAAACGGDDDTATDEDSAVTTTQSSEPTVGGAATILLFNEIASFDPVRMTGSAGADGQRAFPLYGALITYDGTTGEVEPLLAESLEATDFDEWTLVLRDGLVFSDGSPFDANAVKSTGSEHKSPRTDHRRSPWRGRSAR